VQDNILQIVKNKTLTHQISRKVLERKVTNVNQKTTKIIKIGMTNQNQLYAYQLENKVKSFN
jgi:capsular polysaccharide biosynthesis protein